MKGHTVMGLLAHVDAGKTTLSEQILYRAGTLHSLGRVDGKNAFLDYSDIERQRGITVFSDEARFELSGKSFALVDTPGHVDFSGEMERSLSVLDCACLVVSAVEGVQAHTETLWELLQEKNIPTFIFINKLDRDGANIYAVLERFREMSDSGFCLFDSFSESGEISSEAAESVAELDDALLEEYLTSGYDVARWLEAAGKLIRERKMFPVFCGSALKGEGVDELLHGLRLLAPAAEGDSNAEFSGRVYKVRHDKNGRVVYLKVEQGTLHPKDMIKTPEGTPESTPLGTPKDGEKCNELRVYGGPKYELIKEAVPGMLCAVTGIQTARAGDTIGFDAKRSTGFALRPLLSSKVIFDTSLAPPAVMLSRFRELEDEEPLLAVDWISQTEEIEVHIMGEIQLEVLTELVRDRWGVEISFAPCSVLYRETISAPVVGVGHFEPLRHYAEVHLRLSPNRRGEGITFSSECPTDDLSQSWQNLVETHVFEKVHKGVLTGAPLTDVKITLLSGRSHIKHTEGGDFRESTYRAIRQGLMYAENVLLEPWYEFSIVTDYEQSGRVQADMARLGAECKPPRDAGGRALIEGRGPVKKLMDYPRELTAFTKGRGRISFRFGGYEPCREQEEIVCEKNYRAESDLENTPDSVFCSHGAGFPVKWNEVYSYAHLEVEK